MVRHSDKEMPLEETHEEMLTPPAKEIAKFLNSACVANGVMETTSAEHEKILELLRKFNPRAKISDLRNCLEPEDIAILLERMFLESPILGEKVAVLGLLLSLPGETRVQKSAQANAELELSEFIVRYMTRPERLRKEELK